MQHTLDLIQTVAFLAAFTALASRLFVASRPFWSKFPAWVQTFLPALVPALAALAQGLTGVRSWGDLSVLFMVSAGMLMPGLPSNRSAAPLQAGKNPKLEPSVGDVAVAETVIAKRSQRPPPLTDDDDTPASRMFPPSVPPIVALLLAVCFTAHSTACGSAPPKAPCDGITLAAIDAECTAQAFQCGRDGIPKEECTAIDACYKRLDARREVCK